jgi:hypothetical protein
LRADIPPFNYKFSGVITGGNGRATGGPAQTNIYHLDVPPGQKDLSIGFTFTDPGQEVFAVLTAPDGQVYSFQSNINADETQLLNTIQIFRRSPQAGQWILSLEVTNPVSGQEVAQKFSVAVAYNGVNIHASGLPNSTNTKLAAGVPVTIPVTVKNTGVKPIGFFADGRLTTVGTLALAELSGNSVSALPVPAGVSPAWLVPSEVTELDASAVADQPVNMDFFYQSGEPDVYSAAVGNGASVKVTAKQVSPGIWVTDIGQTGPFAGPAPVGMVTVSASAQGQLFDPAITSSTGDFWQEGLAGGFAGVSPLVINPGQTGTINVTITPSGAVGTVVKGNIYIDSVDQFTGAADELIALPYTYKIK